jgi:hypothetical protein
MIVFPGAPLITWAIAILMIISTVAFLIVRKSPGERAMLPLLAALIGFYFTGFSWFYPQLLKYQSTNEAGRTIAERGLKEKQYYLAGNAFEHSIDFYSGVSARQIYFDSVHVNEALKFSDTVYVFADEESYASAVNSGCSFSTVKEYDHFGVQFLTTEFLNPATRKAALRKRYLIKVYGW